MNLKRSGLLLFLPAIMATMACVCTSALPFGADDIEATVEAKIGTDFEGLQETAEAIGKEFDSEEAEATVAVAVETVEAVVEGITAPENVELLAPFPIPADIEMILLNEAEQSLLTVKQSKEDLMAFYQTELTAMDLTERELLTVMTGDTFSMVYDGWEDGRSVVVQGTSLGETMSISIRLEEV